MRNHGPTIIPSRVATMGPPLLARLSTLDAAGNGNRGPQHEVLGKLHDGAAHCRWNGFGIGPEFEAYRAQERVDIRG